MAKKCCNCSHIPSTLIECEGRDWCSVCLYKKAQNELKVWMRKYPLFKIEEEIKRVRDEIKLELEEKE